MRLFTSSAIPLLSALTTSALCVAAARVLESDNADSKTVLAHSWPVLTAFASPSTIRADVKEQSTIPGPPAEPVRRLVSQVRATPPPSSSAGHTLSVESQASLDPASLSKRWTDVCGDDCVGSTGVKSFKSASKSLTDDCEEYPQARKTVLKHKKTVVKTVDGCKTTVTKKVKQTQYILWVRKDKYAYDSHALRLAPHTLAIFSAVIFGAALIWWQ